MRTGIIRAFGRRSSGSTAVSDVTTTLWNLAKGQSADIDSFHENLREEYRVRLMELGFHPGERVSCLQAPALGAPRVFRVANTVFSLDDHVASYVQVRPLLDD